MKSWHRGFDTTIIGWVQRIPRSFDKLFVAVTHIGDPIAVVFIAAAVMGAALTSRSGPDLMFAALMIPLTLFVGAMLKQLFSRARPLTQHAYNLQLDTFSFPSGHSSGSMIAYGLLAYLSYIVIPSWYGIAGAVVLGVIPLLVGISRVYVGVHYPTDVVAGWLLGLLALAVIVLGIQPLS